MTFSLRHFVILLAGTALVSQAGAAAHGQSRGAGERADPAQRSFPSDTFQPSTPLRQFPSETFSPAQVRTLEAQRIRTAEDFMSADARALGRILNLRPRRVAQLQEETRARMGVEREGQAFPSDTFQRGRREFPSDTFQPEQREFPSDTFQPSQREFPGDSFEPSQQAFPGDHFQPGQREFPSDIFQPSTPLRAFPSETFSPAELRALGRLRIETAQDLVEADPRRVGRALDMSPREASGFQAELRQRMTR